MTSGNVASVMHQACRSNSIEDDICAMTNSQEKGSFSLVMTHKLLSMP